MENAFERHAQSLLGVAAALPADRDLSAERTAARAAQERGYFTPAEDELLRLSYAHYLSARAALRSTLNEMQPELVRAGWIRKPETTGDRATFLLAFTAAAMLMRMATTLVEKFGKDKVVWRKLDEAEPRYGIPRKQFTRIYRRLAQPETAFVFHQALRCFDEIQPELRQDPAAADSHPRILELAEAEREWHRRLRRRDQVKRSLRYRIYSWRRRNRSSWEQTLFAIMEWGGTTVSEVRNPFHVKRVRPEAVREVAEMLRPGDILVTRHDDAMTNLFLPGFWPHAALCIGTEAQRAELLGMTPHPDGGTDAEGRPIRVLESQKDGVRFRPLEETLAVDAFVLIRPRLEATALRTALERAMSHAGKLYDFNFDFTKSDRMVCTEVVYRGFDGVGGLRFDLTERSGRLNLSAEDLLDRAVEGRDFEAVAICGVGSNDLRTGPSVRAELAASYRADAGRQ